MSKSYTDLSEVIIDKLEALENDDDETIFVGVYDVEETEPKGYPCAFVKESAGEGSILDTARNEREWQFEVILMQKISKAKTTPEEAVAIMRKIVDKVIEMFDQDPQLEVDGVQQCMRIKVVPLTFNYSIGESPCTFARFLVSCVDLVRRFP